MPCALSAVLMKDQMDREALKDVLLNEGRTGLCEFVQTSNDDEDDI